MCKESHHNQLSSLLPAAQATEESTSQRDLAGIPSFVVTTESTLGSRVAWSIFEKDDHPLVQDTKEKTIHFVDAKEYRDGQTYVDLVPGQDYCLRAYKGDDEYEFGSRFGRNVLQVSYFDGVQTIDVADAHVVIYRPNLRAVCFTARADLLAKYTPDLLYCESGGGSHERILLLQTIGVLDTYSARLVREEAYQVAATTNLPGKYDGQQDAFRHCYFTCRLTQEIGLDQALEAGDIHESCFYEGRASAEMDLHNNRVGGEIGDATVDDFECKSGCLAAVRNRELVWLYYRRNLRGGSQ